MENYFVDQEYENIDYTNHPFQIGEYETCIFSNCNFSAVALKNASFIDCVFNHCNISNALLNETVIRDVRFHHCKMLGLRFDCCSEFLFSASFTHCTLNFSSFYKLKIKKTNFKECIIQEVDFSKTDLSETIFERCDLKDATFDNTILEKTDFTTAFNYRIDPENNKIRKAKFSRDGLAALLTKYDIQIR